MPKGDANATVRKFYMRKIFLRVFGWGSLLGLLVLTALFAPYPIVVAACVVLLYYSLMMPARRVLVFRPIQNILDVEMDAETYAAVVNSGKILRKGSFSEFLAAYFTGDYQRAVDLCLKAINDPKEKGNRLFYIAFLANVYFEAEDDEMLLDSCDAFETLLSKSENGALVKEQYPTMDFYRLYLSGDYDGCLELRDKTVESIGQDSNARLRVVRWEYFTAKILYLKGETADARERFERIVESAPGLNFAKLARAYLKIMEENKEPPTDGE